MEWEYSKAPDWRNVIDMIAPINVADRLSFAVRIERLGEGLANEVLLEALAAVYSPGQNPVLSSSITPASLLQSTQSQAEIDISASFWQDKMTTLQNFIAESKI